MRIRVGICITCSSYSGFLLHDDSLRDNPNVNSTPSVPSTPCTFSHLVLVTLSKRRGMIQGIRYQLQVTWTLMLGGNM